MEQWALPEEWAVMESEYMRPSKLFQFTYNCVQSHDLR